jgi:hypothetical protein
MLILEILFIMTMFLWFLTVLPVPQIAPFSWTSNILAWIAVLLLGLTILLPMAGRL